MDTSYTPVTRRVYALCVKKKMSVQLSAAGITLKAHGGKQWRNRASFSSQFW